MNTEAKLPGKHIGYYTDRQGRSDLGLEVTSPNFLYQVLYAHETTEDYERDEPSGETAPRFLSSKGGGTRC